MSKTYNHIFHTIVKFYDPHYKLYRKSLNLDETIANPYFSGL